MLNEEQKSQVIGLCQDLIRQESYSGNESGVAGVLENFFNDNGFDNAVVDAYGNIYGVIKGNAPGKKILFDGHMDTVPVGDLADWSKDPFAGEIVEDRLYGRGTSDMKGAIAAMASAAAQFAKKTQKQFPGEIYVAGIVHEECFEGIAARKMSESVQPDLVVIGEASNLNLKIGQRGRGEVVVETFGVPAHSASPEAGKNAVYAMAKVIGAIREIEAPVHPILGKGILELTDIKSSPYPGASVVPSYCKATYDRRLLVGDTKESVLAPIQAVIDALSAEDKEVDAKVSFAVGEEDCYTGEKIKGERFFPGWLMDENSETVQTVKKHLEDKGFKPQVTYYNFCTNGSHYAGEAGIETIGLGPSDEKLAHTIDEYIELGQLTGAVESYMGIMEAYLV
ncbi:YgeY family selenium metabolism-linked hydrolase [Eubacteriaceae bacterium ES3]|nr:YgeY family selenium metabolism-linked hydrolase [Eubacteriaceae bacterium ES3]